jgi:hypothetical protein
MWDRFCPLIYEIVLMKYLLLTLLLSSCYNRYDDTHNCYYHQYKYKDDTIRLLNKCGFRQTKISKHEGNE